MNVFEAMMYADNLVKRCNKGSKKAKGDSEKGVSISGGNNSTLSESVPYEVGGDSTIDSNTSTNGKLNCTGRVET